MHAWLHRKHGLILLVSPVRQYVTRSGSAIWARVISTRSQTPSAMAASANDTSTTDPWSTTGVPPACGRIAAQRSRLNPAGTCQSGRVCSTEKMAPRTITR